MIGRLLSPLKLAVLCLLAIWTAPLAAHSTPNSEIRLRLAGDVVIADVVVPRSEYTFGTGYPAENTPHAQRIARDYLRAHMNVATPDGKAWTVRFRKVEFEQSVVRPDLHAIAEFSPPEGASPHELVIDWRVLTRTLPGHFALFLVEGDGKKETATIVGAVQAGSPALEISIDEHGAAGILTDAMGLGAHHILKGYDHLLFLLVLLLPSPLLARNGEWVGHRPSRQTIVKLAQIVTAFTVGHSLTLVAATIGQISLPSTPVEVAIAISVLVSAMHASRPLLAGREPVVALAFGLVHGLAFATLVQEANAGMVGSILTLLGFNLGIELVQVGIVAAVIPSLLVLSRYPLYSALRQTLALLSATAALAWIVNRTTGLAAGTVGLMEGAMSHLGWLVPMAGLIALALFIRRGAGTTRNRTVEMAAT